VPRYTANTALTKYRVSLAAKKSRVGAGVSIEAARCRCGVARGLTADRGSGAVGVGRGREARAVGREEPAADSATADEGWVMIVALG
jgi:hypothetical protein